MGLAGYVKALMINDAEFAPLRRSVNGAGPKEAIDSMQKLANAVSAANLYLLPRTWLRYQKMIYSMCHMHLAT